MLLLFCPCKVRGGQRSKVKVTIHLYGNKLVNTIETKPLCASSSNLARHVSHSERMDHIDFGGQRSMVKVTIDIYRNKLVNTIETSPPRWRRGSGLDFGSEDPGLIPRLPSPRGGPSDGKEVKDVFRRPGARVEVGSAR